MEHCLDTCGIAIHEKKTEEFGEAMVYLAGTLVFALELKAYHARELLGQSITNDTDDSLGTARNHREREGIVATYDGKVLRLVLDNLIHLLKTATCLLDSHDVLAVAGKTNSCFSLEVDSRAPRYII